MSFYGAKPPKVEIKSESHISHRANKILSLRVEVFNPQLPCLVFKVYQFYFIFSLQYVLLLNFFKIFFLIEIRRLIQPVGGSFFCTPKKKCTIKKWENALQQKVFTFIYFHKDIAEHTLTHPHKPIQTSTHCDRITKRVFSILFQCTSCMYVCV